MGEKTIFLCEDSTDGIFTGVYDAWASRLGHGNVKLALKEDMNYELFARYLEVEPDGEKAGKVEMKIIIIFIAQPCRAAGKRQTIFTGRWQRGFPGEGRERLCRIFRIPPYAGFLSFPVLRGMKRTVTFSFCVSGSWRAAYCFQKSVRRTISCR